MSGATSFAMPLIVAGVAAVRLASRSNRSRGSSGGSAKARGPKPVEVDSEFGDAELGELRVAAVRGDWSAMEAVLEPVRARGDFGRLTWLLDNIDDVKNEALLALPMRAPDSALARTVTGARYVRFAWEARTGARASSVSQQQFTVFHERLRQAEDYLYAAIELDPESAAPWYFLTTTSRGLEHGHEMTRRRFEAGVARDPYHYGLHASMLQQVCQKWSGSHGEMHTFARESMLKAPGGSPLGTLVATAHLENWLDLPKAERNAYMVRLNVADSLNEAAAASVDHPDFAPTTTPHTALNTFAMAFWLAGEPKAAARMFKRIEDHVTKAPWNYMGDPGRVFAAARSECKKR